MIADPKAHWETVPQNPGLKLDQIFVIIPFAELAHCIFDSVIIAVTEVRYEWERWA
jgi:hypothetical protein